MAKGLLTLCRRDGCFVFLALEKSYQFINIKFMCLNSELWLLIPTSLKFDLDLRENQGLHKLIAHVISRS